MQFQDRRCYISNQSSQSYTWESHQAIKRNKKLCWKRLWLLMCGDFNTDFKCYKCFILLPRGDWWLLPTPKSCNARVVVSPGCNMYKNKGVMENLRNNLRANKLLGVILNVKPFRISWHHLFSSRILWSLTSFLIHDKMATFLGWVWTITTKSSGIVCISRKQDFHTHYFA